MFAKYYMSFVIFASGPLVGPSAGYHESCSQSAATGYNNAFGTPGTPDIEPRTNIVIEHKTSLKPFMLPCAGEQCPDDM